MTRGKSAASFLWMSRAFFKVCSASGRGRRFLAARHHLEVRVGQLIAILGQVGEFVDQSLKQVDRAPKVLEGWLRADGAPAPGKAPSGETLGQILAILGEGRRPVGQLLLERDGRAEGYLRIARLAESPPRLSRDSTGRGRGLAGTWCRWESRPRAAPEEPVPRGGFSPPRIATDIAEEDAEIVQGVGEDLPGTPARLGNSAARAFSRSMASRKAVSAWAVAPRRNWMSATRRYALAVSRRTSGSVPPPCWANSW